MTIRQVICLIKADNNRAKYKSFLLNLITPIFAIVFWFRIVNFLRQYILLRPIYWLSFIPFSFYKYITGIQLYDGTNIGGGLRCFHYSCIVVARKAVIGKNCSLHQGVTIGKQFGGRRYGFPIIGDNCIIFPGAKIIGSVNIGNNVIIGTNAVVISDIPDNCVVVGSPARIVSDNSSSVIDKWDYKYYFKLQ